MFEQSILASASKAKRIWAASLGVTGQVMLVAAMILAPMLWPEVMPRAAFTMIVPHAPPGRAAKGKEDARPHRAARAVRPFQYQSGLTQPQVIPARVVEIVDPGPADNGFSVVGGVDTSIGGGGGNGLIDSIMRAGTEVERPAPEPTPRAAEKPKAEPAPIRRVKSGGVVQAPKLIRRIDPRYPDIAKRAGISGVVKLTGVIGTDGRIRELAVASGNPLLVPAAVEAVREWLYQPTLLNGDPVEVVTEIVVTFTLAR